MAIKRSKENDEYIIKKISEGETTTNIAKSLGIAVGTINQWRDEDDNLDLRCTRARRRALDIHVEKMREVSETMPDVQRARLICDNTKWEAARIAPDKYGDRIEVNVNKTTDIRGALDEAQRRLLLRCSEAKQIDSQVIDVTHESTKRASDCESLVQSDSSDALTKVQDGIPPDFMD